MSIANILDIWQIDDLLKFLSAFWHIGVAFFFGWLISLTCILKRQKKKYNKIWVKDGSEVFLALIFSILAIMLIFVAPAALVIAIIGLICFGSIKLITYLVNKSW